MFFFSLLAYQLSGYGGYTTAGVLFTLAIISRCNEGTKLYRTASLRGPKAALLWVLLQRGTATDQRLGRLGTGVLLFASLLCIAVQTPLLFLEELQLVFASAGAEARPHLGGFLETADRCFFQASLGKCWGTNVELSSDLPFPGQQATLTC